ncbi:hypothetical protein cce_4014 [Crocosphaera subtropica ATCC 51142]|uniref:Uncharacterized protein n=1 Tax=Crocosphaera subtropica (strain ATCC 51142 / BH68) TaxID=43989 RepID=B1WQR0_CROS5|nr:hypothetical protein cce_4014 [Crocosphaera subtropica ATCC 51142]
MVNRDKPITKREIHQEQWLIVTLKTGKGKKLAKLP